MIFIIVSLPIKLVHVVINPLFELVSFSFNSFDLDIIFDLDIFDSSLFFDISLLTFFLLLQNLQLSFDTVEFCNFNVKFVLNRFKVFEKNIDAILQLVDF